MTEVTLTDLVRAYSYLPNVPELNSLRERMRKKMEAMVGDVVGKTMQPEEAEKPSLAFWPVLEAMLIDDDTIVLAVKGWTGSEPPEDSMVSGYVGKDGVSVVTAVEEALNVHKLSKDLHKFDGNKEFWKMDEAGEKTIIEHEKTKASGKGYSKL